MLIDLVFFSEYDCIMFEGLDFVMYWCFSVNNEELSVLVNFCIRVNLIDIVVYLVWQGLGIVRVLFYQVLFWLKSGEFNCVLQEFVLEFFLVNLFYICQDVLFLKQCSFIDFMIL